VDTPAPPLPNRCSSSEPIEATLWLVMPPSSTTSSSPIFPGHLRWDGLIHKTQDSAPNRLRGTFSSFETDPDGHTPSNRHLHEAFSILGIPGGPEAPCARDGSMPFIAHFSLALRIHLFIGISLDALLAHAAHNQLLYSLHSLRALCLCLC
jgi:hypothetical protein